MCNREIWKPALKKMREKKSWEFSTFLADSQEKKLLTNQILVKRRHYSGKWYPTTWKQLFVYPVGLTKALQEFDMAAPTITTLSKISTSNNKISSNSNQKFFQNIHRKIPVLKSSFNKVSGLQPAALSKKRLRHRCFPVKLLRTRFLSNTSR